jgi:hypothetical protein
MGIKQFASIHEPLTNQVVFISTIIENPDLYQNENLGISKPGNGI